MEHETAKAMMVCLAQIEASLGRLGDLTLDIEDEKERLALRLGVAELMGRHFTDVMLPIIRQYPELDPDKAGKDWYNTVRRDYVELCERSRTD